MITGYIGIGPEEGKFVSDEDAFQYAKEQCLNGTADDQKDFKEEFGDILVNWYFSGNWLKGELQGE